MPVVTGKSLAAAQGQGAYWVTIQLVADLTTGKGIGYVVGTNEIVGPQKVDVAADGTWTATLTANATITPANTVYKVTEHPAKESFYVSVPDVAGPVVASSILASLPGALTAGNAPQSSLDAETAAREAGDDIAYAAIASETARAVAAEAAFGSGTFQPLDSDLTAIAALSTTSFGRALLALADAAAGRTAFGLGTAATSASTAFDAAGAAAAAQAASQPVDSDLTAIAALTTTSFGRSFLALADAAAGRTLLGLGTAATSATTAFDASGAAAAAQAYAVARANHTGTQLAATISDFDTQVRTSRLDQMAATTSAQLRTVLSDETGTGAAVFANAPALVSPTGIVKGDVGLGNVDNTADTNKPVSTAQAAADAAVLAAAQPLDPDLTTIAGLTATTDSFLQSKGSAWAARTIAQVKADLGLTGTNSGDQTITLTGDVTGSGAGSFAATLATSGVTAAAYGDATHVTQVTFDAKGRATTAVAVAITGLAESAVTNLVTDLSTLTTNVATNTAAIALLPTVGVVTALSTGSNW